jgi:hypothetical protein
MKIKVAVYLIIQIILYKPLEAQKVQVVNMVSKSRSNETGNDSEPTLSVNPNNPLHMAATAFTPDPLGGENAPIYVSSDGGNTWDLNPIIPGNIAIIGTGDVTLDFSGNADNLYISDLRGDSHFTLNVLLSKNFTELKVADIIKTQISVDQPFVQVFTDSNRSEQIFIGYNYTYNICSIGGNGKTASIMQLHKANLPTANYSGPNLPIERREPLNQDAPSVRCFIHPAGIIYGIYSQYTDSGKNIIVVRDDHWGNSNFSDLKDPSDGTDGIIVRKKLSHEFDNLGLQSIGDNVSIAGDPNHVGSIFIAYNDSVTHSTIHIISSIDSGKTWSTTDLMTVNNSTNPALSVNSDGRLGLVYQQLVTISGNFRWQTHFRSTMDGLHWDDLLLSNTPNGESPDDSHTYLGDYINLVSVGKSFYGIFSALNTPDSSNFNYFPIYKRNVDLMKKRLLSIDSSSYIDNSIDPFFFSIKYSD